MLLKFYTYSILVVELHVGFTWLFFILFITRYSIDSNIIYILAVRSLNVFGSKLSTKICAPSSPTYLKAEGHRDTISDTTEAIY